MKKKLLLCSALLTLTCQAGAAAQAQVTMAPGHVPAGMSLARGGVVPISGALINGSILGLIKQPRRDAAPSGMPVCEDAGKQTLCRVGLGNGDFEHPHDPKAIAGWVLKAGEYSLDPYLGSTPDSRVLAMPGRAALAASGALLPQASTSAASAVHTYTVRLRARGSGPMPANVETTLMLGGSKEGDAIHYLASADETVGWDWKDIEFKVETAVEPSEALMLIGIERKDNNTPTMLWVDDVRIIRTPAGVTPDAD